MNYYPYKGINISYSDNNDRFLHDVLENKEYDASGIFKPENKYPVVIDLGAHIGTFTFFIFELADTIYSLEPINIHYDCLIDTINNNHLDKIHAFNLGVAKETGKRNFHIDPVGGGSKMLEGEGEVSVISLDDFFEQEKIKHVDLMKVDIENSEHELFSSNGFRKVANYIDIIMGEPHEGGKVDDYLIPLGFKMFNFEGHFLAKRI